MLPSGHRSQVHGQSAQDQTAQTPSLPSLKLPDSAQLPLRSAGRRPRSGSSTPFRNEFGVSWAQRSRVSNMQPCTVCRDHRAEVSGAQAIAARIRRTSSKDRVLRLGRFR